MSNAAVPAAACGNLAAEGRYSDCFRARITPHRSLSDQACNYVFVALLLVSIVFQLGFLAYGIWPAALFLAFDTGFLILALCVVRLDQIRAEEVEVANGHLRIRNIQQEQVVRTVELPLFGLGIECCRDPEFGLLSITTMHRERHIEIARDLSPGERDEFLEALLTAIANAGSRPRVVSRGLSSARE